MKQIIQDLKSGKTLLAEVPVPKVRKGFVLIQTKKSLVSLGTERMLVSFARANYLSKARQQPEKVKQVIEKIKTDGLSPTLNAVFSKLGQPLPLGYCNAGEVVDVGEGVSQFKKGDRVVSNGPHSEYVCVGQNLVAKIPANVSYDSASFTVVGAIGLQGIRLLNPTFGERFVIIGMGLIGLITGSLLKANGCEVIGVDFDEEKLKIAREKGIITVDAKQTDALQFVLDYTNGVGSDGVIITASSKSNKIIEQSAQMCRKRGRVILIGVVGLNINRSDFYKKEISFQVSCSYGPGRYDSDYEEKGNDYPIGFVRWTEQRNFEAVLGALSSKKIEVSSLITERVSLSSYEKIYNNIGSSQSIASILEYNSTENLHRVVMIGSKKVEKQKGVIGIIGSGNFTSGVILPQLKKIKTTIKMIGSSSGLSSTSLAKKYNIRYSTTDYREILKDKDIDLVFITTRHNSHYRLVLDAMAAKKNVFTEKPLALNNDELSKIIQSYEKHSLNIAVGFNRRFAPLSQEIKRRIPPQIAINIIITINAGHIPLNSWVHDMEEGGGRIIGEACHFIDLAMYFSGSKVQKVCMNALGVTPSENTDNATILLQHANGSQSSINYFSNGSKAYSKERIEIYFQGKTMILDNWRKLKTYGFSRNRKFSRKQNKGHYEQFKALIKGHLSGTTIIPFEEIVNTTRASFAALISLKQKKWEEIK